VYNAPAASNRSNGRDANGRGEYPQHGSSASYEFDRSLRGSGGNHEGSRGAVATLPPEEDFGHPSVRKLIAEERRAAAQAAAEKTAVAEPVVASHGASDPRTVTNASQSQSTIYPAAREGTNPGESIMSDVSVTDPNAPTSPPQTPRADDAHLSPNGDTSVSGAEAESTRDQQAAFEIESALRGALNAVSSGSGPSGSDSSDEADAPSSRPRVVAKMEHDDSLYVVFRVPLANREHLTRREIEVVLSIGEGLRNREIAQKLGISAATVAAHVRNIFRKLRVKTRTECARYVLTSVGAGDSAVSTGGAS